MFASPRACAGAAIGVQRALVAHGWPTGERVRVRMGIDGGEVSRTAAGLAGVEVRGAARIAAVAHGGQVVVSAAAARLLGGSLPAGVWLEDLGRHRLTDGGRSEQIFQLQAEGLPSAFPPLRSLDNPRLLNNLPAQVSSFIGRKAELAAVGRLVAGSRLVTLTGVGGAGKTRLGLQVAAGLLDGAGDGVWFADLAPVRRPGPGRGDGGRCAGRAPGAGPPVDGHGGGGGGRAAPAGAAGQLRARHRSLCQAGGRAAPGCPGLALLATSREPLGIGGEYVYRVPSLGVPADGDDAGVIRASEAVRLLAERAAAQGVPLAGDEEAAGVAGRICRRLDGIPLALELAAARLRGMPAAELDARLDQRFALLTSGSRAALPRQQTLRAMVEWSWELLNPAEGAVLAALSTFAGGFGLAAAEAVTDGLDVPAAEVLGHLGTLVDKSLVQFGDTGTGPGRYRLLETVRQYAAGQLDARSPEAADAARIAHRDYYLALAEAAAPHLVGADQAVWLDRLDAELGNLRAAIASSLTQADPVPGLRLAASLRVYWKARGHGVEGADMLRALLEVPAPQGAMLPRARGLAAAAYLLGQTSGYAAAADYCEEALAIARAAGDDYLVADLLDEQAWVLLSLGQQDAALPLIERGLGLACRLGELHLTARLLSTRSYASYVAGEPCERGPRCRRVPAAVPPGR